MLCYGESGVGKTTLCATAPKPIIISAEKGLLALAEKDIPVIDVTNLEGVLEAHKFLLNNNDYETICIDSLSELAEKLLIEFKGEVKDARKAYGRLNDEIATVIRLFRDLPNKHVFFICKQTRIVDEFSGKIIHGPLMPGKALPLSIPYYFDIVTCMRVGVKDKAEFRYLQTQPSLQYEAKDRSGKLDSIEKTDLNYIFNKIRGK